MKKRARVREQRETASGKAYSRHTNPAIPTAGWRMVLNRAIRVVNKFVYVLGLLGGRV